MSVIWIPVSVMYIVPSGPTARSLSSTAPYGRKSISPTGAPVRLSKPRSTSMSAVQSVSPWNAIPFGASSRTPLRPLIAHIDAFPTL